MRRLIGTTFLLLLVLPGLGRAAEGADHTLRRAFDRLIGGGQSKNALVLAHIDDTFGAYYDARVAKGARNQTIRRHAADLLRDDKEAARLMAELFDASKGVTVDRLTKLRDDARREIAKLAQKAKPTADEKGFAHYLTKIDWASDELISLIQSRTNLGAKGYEREFRDTLRLHFELLRRNARRGVSD